MDGSFFYDGNSVTRLDATTEEGVYVNLVPSVIGMTSVEALHFARSPAFIDKVIMEGKMKDAIFRLRNMKPAGAC